MTCVFNFRAKLTILSLSYPLSAIKPLAPVFAISSSAFAQSAVTLSVTRNRIGIPFLSTARCALLESPLLILLSLECRLLRLKRAYMPLCMWHLSLSIPDQVLPPVVQAIFPKCLYLTIDKIRDACFSNFHSPTEDPSTELPFSISKIPH